MPPAAMALLRAGYGCGSGRRRRGPCQASDSEQPTFEDSLLPGQTTKTQTAAVTAASLLRVFLREIVKNGALLRGRLLVL